MKATIPTAEPPLNEFQAAAALGVSVHTLRQRRFRGLKPPFLKIGKSVRYEVQNLQDFLESCRIPSGTAPQR